MPKKYNSMSWGWHFKQWHQSLPVKVLCNNNLTLQVLAIINKMITNGAPKCANKDRYAVSS